MEAQDRDLEWFLSLDEEERNAILEEAIEHFGRWLDEFVARLSARWSSLLQEGE